MHPQFVATFKHFSSVPQELKDELWHYFAYGIDPGSFLTAVLCNSFVDAACCAHSSLRVISLKDMAQWLMHHAPQSSWGDEEKMIAWCRKTDQERMDIMIEYGLRPHEFEILKGTAVA